MVMDYISYFINFVGDAVNQMNQWMVVDGTSFLGFIGAVSIICIVVGMILVR